RMLQQHFAGRNRGDILGLHSTVRDESGDCWSRWLGADIDRHGDEGDPDANLRFALDRHERARRLGFRPLLFDSNGKGGYHLVLLFAGPVATRTVFRFGRWLIRGWDDFGLGKEPEVFPKQPGIAEGKCGNWLRVLGKHHNREHWTRVWDGERWLEGEDA